jgi:hypothetical protein
MARSSEQMMNYRGIAAVILAISLGVAVVAAVVGLAWRDKPMAEVGGQVLLAIGSAMVGALATYMGMKNGQ